MRERVCACAEWRLLEGASHKAQASEWPDGYIVWTVGCPLKPTRPQCGLSRFFHLTSNYGCCTLNFFFFFCASCVMLNCLCFCLLVEPFFTLSRLCAATWRPLHASPPRRLLPCKASTRLVDSTPWRQTQASNIHISNSASDNHRNHAGPCTTSEKSQNVDSSMNVTTHASDTSMNRLNQAANITPKIKYARGTKLAVQA